MRSFFKIGFLLFLSPAAWAEPTQSQIRIAEHFASMVVSVHLKGSESFYGTGWLAKVDSKNKKIYVVLPYHVLPSQKDWSKLSVRNTALGKQAYPLDVVALSPGLDLAIASVSVSADKLPAISKSLEHLKTQLAAPLGSAKQARIAGIGVPTRFPVEDGPHLLFTGTDGEASPYNSGKVLIGVPDFAGTSPIRTLDYCPQLFLGSCYEILSTTRGWSGAMLLQSGVAQPSSASQIGILGMVTHFSPFSPVSYVMPAQEVLKASERLIAQHEKAGKLYPETLDSETSACFRWISPTRVEVLCGSLKGKEVQGVELSTGGGGDASGGGGDASGGGGDASGGGGDPSGGGGDASGGGGGKLHSLVQRDASGNVSGSVPWEKLTLALADPASWHRHGGIMDQLLLATPQFRGGRSLLNYSPGVRIDDKKFDTFNGGPILSLSFFVQKYRAKPKQLPGNQKPYQLPARFRSAGGGDQYTFSSVRRLKALPKSDEVFSIRSEEHGLFPAVFKGFERRNGAAQVLLSVPDMQIEAVALEFPDRFEALGSNTFRYAGKFNTGEHGVVVLQYSPTDSLWEFKALVAVKSSPGDPVPDAAFTTDAFYVDAFYFRLKEK